MKIDNIQIIKDETLSKGKYLLREVTYAYKGAGEKVVRKTREVYDPKDGSTILLYNKEKQTVVLTRQFRLPVYLHGKDDGLMIEACAGKLDEDDPEECVRRETEEETGYRLAEVKKIFEAYTTPGAVQEMLHFFVAPYSDEMKVSKGGGLEEEGEDIEVLELDFREACDLVESGGIKDGKTIMLLQYAQLHRLMEG